MSTTRKLMEQRKETLRDYFRLYGKNGELLYEKVDEALGLSPCPPKGKTPNEKRLRAGFQVERCHCRYRMNESFMKKGESVKYYAIKGKGWKLYTDPKAIALVDSNRAAHYSLEQAKCNIRHLGSDKSLLNASKDRKLIARLNVQIAQAEEEKITHEEDLERNKILEKSAFVRLESRKANREELLAKITKQLPAPPKTKKKKTK